jgi:hypothetical protein
MALVQPVAVLIVVTVVMGLVNRYIPMAGSIKSILSGVVVIGVVLWLLNIFGLFSSLPMINVEYTAEKRSFDGLSLGDMVARLSRNSS